MKMPELSVEGLKVKELHEYRYIAIWSNGEEILYDTEEAVRFAEEKVRTSKEIVSLWLEVDGIRESQPYYINETNMAS